MEEEGQNISYTYLIVIIITTTDSVFTYPVDPAAPSVGGDNLVQELHSAACLHSEGTHPDCHWCLWGLLAHT